MATRKTPAQALVDHARVLIVNRDAYVAVIAAAGIKMVKGKMLGTAGALVEVEDATPFERVLELAADFDVTHCIYETEYHDEDSVPTELIQSFQEADFSALEQFDPGGLPSVVTFNLVGPRISLRYRVESALAPLYQARRDSDDFDDDDDRDRVKLASSKEIRAVAVHLANEPRWATLKTNAQRREMVYEYMLDGIEDGDRYNDEDVFLMTVKVYENETRPARIKVAHASGKSVAAIAKECRCSPAVVKSVVGGQR